MDLLAGLNAPQQAAVLHENGPLLIFAGAGSGKTRTLTHRIAHLIHHRGVSPSRILAVTFTNKAAREMQERLASLAGPESRRLWLGTFHAMCARMLRMHGEFLDIDPRFVIFDSDDSTRLMKEVLREADVDSDRYPAARVLGRISDAKNNMRSPSDVAALAASPADRVIARLYARYQERLSGSRALDFDDLLTFAVKLLRDTPAGEIFAQRFEHILIDEFQDVNKAQFEWARELTRVHKNIAVVGDDDQSIYKWRGADIRLILDFEQEFPDANVIYLEQNYRSTQTILDAAHGVIARNAGRRPKKLWSEESGGLKLELHGLANAQEEAMWVARKIQELQRSGQRPLSDFVILCRVNAQSRPFEEAFIRMRMPLRLVGTQRFYERREIKDLLAYLRVLFNPNDGVALLRIINTPPRGIGATTLERLSQLSATHNLPIFDVIHSDELLAGLGSGPRAKIGAVRHLLDNLGEDLRSSESMAELLNRVIERSGYEEFLRRERSNDTIDRIANVDEFLSAAVAFDDRVRQDGTEDLEESPFAEGPPFLGLFLETTTLDSDAHAATGEHEAVTLMTLHAAKGLEFSVVFVVGAEQGLLPHSRALWGDSPDELEEERRLCYVGLTRARERVFITYAAQRTLHGRTETTQPSQFIEEIPGHLMERGGFASSRSFSPARASTNWATTAMAARPAAAVEPPKFQIGDRVKHPSFGEGLVVTASGSGTAEWVEVAFLLGDTGKKKLIVAYAPLEKV